VTVKFIAWRREGTGERWATKDAHLANPDAGFFRGIVVNITTVKRPAMDRTVAAAEANRRFSELLRTVKTGRSVIVTSHGKPVAKITPMVDDERAAEAARSALFARLRTERTVNIGRWTRHELYDDAP
jgi:prevent-host-death family protein